MDEMTLGKRFRRQVAQWVMGNGDGVPFPAAGELDRLEAYADACERLAKAAVYEDDVKDLDYDDQRKIDAFKAVISAIAAYREEVARG